MEDDKILEYLEKQGPRNTFRLARELDIKRDELLEIIKKLEEKGNLEVRAGTIKFLKYPVEEKTAIVEERPQEEKIENPKIITELRTESGVEKRLEEKIAETKRQKQSKKLERPEKVILSQNKKLREQLLEAEAILKKQSNLKHKLKEQSENIKKMEDTIAELEKTNAELKQKAETPKIIKKTIIKKVPIKEKKVSLRIKPKKTKVGLRIPRFNNWIKKMDFTKLSEKLQRLDIPQVLKR